MAYVKTVQAENGEYQLLKRTFKWWRIVSTNVDREVVEEEKKKYRSMWDKIKLWVKQRAGVEDGPVFEVGKLPPGIGGICVWPFGIVVKKTLTYKRKDCLLLHEQHHWDAQRKTLGLWYVAYFALLPFGKGRNHPLEKPAYAVEDECNQRAV